MTELFVRLQFSAMHSLEENETMHPHTWRVIVGLGGEVTEGRVVSLPRARIIFDEILARVRNTVLNQNQFLDPATRKNPTCENISEFLFKEFANVLEAASEKCLVRSVEVGVIEESGIELGFARFVKTDSTHRPFRA